MVFPLSKVAEKLGRSRPVHQHLARPTNSSWVPPFGSSGDGKILVRRESNEMTGLYDMKRYENLLNW